MAPRGTVRSSGPRQNVLNLFVRPRISTAFADMQRRLVLIDRLIQPPQKIAPRRARFSAFANGLFQQRPCTLDFGRAGAFIARFRDKRAHALATVDDALALEFLVSAFDGDDADEQVLGESSERWKRGARRQPALADFALHAPNDLVVQRA